MNRTRFASALAMAAMAAILLPSFLHAQITCERTYGGVLDDCAYSIQQTTDSGCIMTGYTESFGAGLWDVYVIRTNASGDTLWTRTYGGRSTDYGLEVQQTADGGYIIAGSTRSFGAGGWDVYLIKTDARGDTLWTRTFGGTAYDRAYSIQQTADSGYIMTGYTESFGAGSWDVYVIRTDSSGDTVWMRTFGGVNRDDSYSVQQTTDAGCVIAGYATSFGAGAEDVYFIKTDATGGTLWTRTFGGAGDNVGYSVQQTPDGGYIVAGSTSSSGAGGVDVYLIKTDALGRLAVAEPKTSPTHASTFSLSCEPNPSSGTTTIRLSPFALRHSPLTLRMYDSQGRVVLTRQVSTSSFPLSTSDLASGAYFIRCDAAGEHATARVVLQR